jgi:hypothetical protein
MREKSKTETKVAGSNGNDRVGTYFANTEDELVAIFKHTNLDRFAVSYRGAKKLYIRNSENKIIEMPEAEGQGMLRNK